MIILGIILTKVRNINLLFIYGLLLLFELALIDPFLIGFIRGILK